MTRFAPTAASTGSRVLWIPVQWAALRWCAALLLMTALLAPGASAAQLQAGDSAPRLDIQLLDGSTLPAKALEGKVVVSMFWATWCHICVADMPKMQQLHETYGARGLVILAISLDRDREEVLHFLGATKYSFAVAMRSGAMREEYGSIRGTPTYFIADRRGVVRMHHLGAPPEGVIEVWIQDLLKEKARPAGR